MSAPIAVVHEAEADFEIATGLAERVLVDAIEWLDDELIVDVRPWVKASPNGDALTWMKIKRLAIEADIVAMGHFEGEPGMPDAQAARRAILYLRKTFPDLAGVMLVRDQDDQPERKQGLNQARQEHHGELPVVVGLAVVERECWVLSGFDPLSDAESGRLEEERKRLGFDPRLRSHELTACKDNKATRSAKRVLQQLTGGELQREQKCWQETGLAALRERGTENGLAEFLAEVKDKFASLIGHAN